MCICNMYVCVCVIITYNIQEDREKETGLRTEVSTLEQSSNQMFLRSSNFS